MEGLKAKLSRTSSSLSRSPTVRSLSPNLSSSDEENQHLQLRIEAEAETEVEEKIHHQNSKNTLKQSLFLLLLLPLLFSLFYLNNLLVSSLSILILFLSILIYLKNYIKKIAPCSSSSHWFIGDEDYYNTDYTLHSNNEGVVFYRNGDFYEGEFHNGICNGSGTYTFLSRRGRYEGDWIGGKYDGFGIERWAMGSRYWGQFRNGLRHGFGVYTFHSGDSYAGEWVSGQSSGTGVQTCADGSCYVGRFRAGVKHGIGFYNFRNEDKYGGEYFGDKIHGFGVYHFANGHCYQGSWHDGRRQGYGTYTFGSGETSSGEWDCGLLKLSLPPSNNSVRCAVRSARKAVDDAVRAPRLEEQVNHAVAAAKRAATAARVASAKAAQNHRMDGKFSETDE